MAVQQLKSIQKIPASLETVWELFSNPDNLRVITPPGMGFRVISKEQAPVIYAGQIIEYRLKPLLGIPVYWKTAIAEVRNREYFMDIQLKGPYKLWRHQHYFKEIKGGVEMTDIVQYKIPLWILGHLANALLVKRKLRQIFKYRFQKVEELFGKWEGQSISIEIN